MKGTVTFIYKYAYDVDIDENENFTLKDYKDKAIEEALDCLYFDTDSTYYDDCFVEFEGYEEYF
jgi:hypothetical protein